MTTLQAVQELLRSEWETSIDGRWNDVPEPEIVLEKAVSEDDLKTSDVIRIVDGGNKEKTPLGFGWTHEQVDQTATVQIRSADRRLQGKKIDGRVRTFGERNTDPDDPDHDYLAGERYGGLAGEVERICDSNRKGVAEFDRVVCSPIRDESQLTGTNHYRADLDIGLVQDASEINPDPTL